MTWTKLDEGFSDHPKLIAVGPLAELLQVRALQYSNRYLTDGYIPATSLSAIARGMAAYREDGRRVTGEALADKLIRFGIWDREEDGYRIHDFHGYQPAKEDVLSKREHISQVRAAAGRIGGIRSGEARKQTQSKVVATIARQLPRSIEANAKPRSVPVPLVEKSNSDALPPSQVEPPFRTKQFRDIVCRLWAEHQGLTTISKRDMDEINRWVSRSGFPLEFWRKTISQTPKPAPFTYLTKEPAENRVCRLEEWWIDFQAEQHRRNIREEQTARPLREILKSAPIPA